MRAPAPLLAFALFGCTKGASDDSAAAPTWYADVSPILDGNCVSCHTEGGIGMMPLESYDDVADIGDWIASAVVDRRMPPGQPDLDCQDYAGMMELSEEQIATIDDWAAAGAPEGDPADAREPEYRDDLLSLSRVDMTLELPEPYTPQNSPDDYRCFLADWPEEEAIYVTGFGVEPGEPAIVHHVIVFIAEPDRVAEAEALDAAEEGAGWTCYGGPGLEAEDAGIPWLGGWVPGQNGRDLPEGTGVAMEPGSKLIVQVHYNTDADTADLPDQSSVLLKVDDEVDKVGQTQPFLDRDWVTEGTMEIPANTDGVSHSHRQVIPIDLTLHDVGMHMHKLGAAGDFRVIRQDGGETCLVTISEWDYDWQTNYRLAEPVVVEAGDELEVTCTFDNPTDEDVNWGEGTDEEMCMGILYGTMGG